MFVAASKGLKAGHAGLSKIKETGVGGPAVELALRGIKLAEVNIGMEGREGVEKIEGCELATVPPSPPKRKKTRLTVWMGYKDEDTGDTYFVNPANRRVTWTEPKSGFYQK
jgi:hypothetical protein